LSSDACSETVEEYVVNAELAHGLVS